MSARRAAYEALKASDHAALRRLADHLPPADAALADRLRLVAAALEVAVRAEALGVADTPADDAVYDAARECGAAVRPRFGDHFPALMWAMQEGPAR